MAQQIKISLIVVFLELTGLILWAMPAQPGAYAQSAYPLHAAAKRGDVQALQTLIANQANINQQDKDGWTPLMHAVRAGQRQSIDILLKAGAIPNIADKLGRTALELAGNHPVSMSRQLIEAGADVNRRNTGGIPVILVAAGQGRQDLVEYLLSAGARIDYKDYQGNSILDWSARSGNTKLINYLKPRLKKALANLPKKSTDDFDESKFADAVHPKWFKHSFLDLNEDLKEALEGGKKGLMVYFGLKRCSYCQAFMDNTLAKPDIEQRTRRLFDAVGMSIFSDNELIDPTGKTYVVKDFVTLKKANFSPTMIFYGPGGRELLKIIGYYPPKKFRLVLDYLEGEFYNRETLHAYIARHQSATAQAKSVIQHDKLFPNKNYQLFRKTKPAKRPLVVLFEQPNCD
ncbi:MAG: ankyrin repeat domain-containing protein, partial [Thioalkalispiraceae bacterium]